MLRPSIILSCFIFSTLFFTPLFACSLAFLNQTSGTAIAARSMDLCVDDQPKIVVYPRGMIRDGGTDGNTLHWTSLYGSVVVTALNVGVSDGVNEKGLAAHLLYMQDTKYESPDPFRPTVSIIRWIQYLLDNYQSVNDVLANLNKVRIVPRKIVGQEWPLHLAIEDNSGDAAVIEYINGHAVVYHDPLYQVLTNEPGYDKQLDNLKQYKLFGGTLAMPGDVDSMSRFVRAFSYLKTLPVPANDSVAIAYAFSIIRNDMTPYGAIDTSGDKLAKSCQTRWIAVADLNQGVYYFAPTNRPDIIWLNLKRLNFNSNAPTLSIDPMTTPWKGDVTQHLTS